MRAVDEPGKVSYPAAKLEPAQDRGGGGGGAGAPWPAPLFEHFGEAGA